MRGAYTREDIMIGAIWLAGLWALVVMALWRLLCSP